MKRRYKANTGIYAFLDASGVLENGTANEIKLAKDQYWKDYKKKWKKEKQKISKTFEITFDLKGLRIINKEAEKYNMKPVKYIKQSALTNSRGLTDKIAVAEIRELVIGHYTTLINLMEENEIQQSIGRHLLDQASEIEKKVLNFFHSKIEVIDH